MKWFVFFLSVLILIPFIHADCLTSSDEYAVELVVPNYTFFGVSQIASPHGTLYESISQYSPKLITLLSESREPAGLVVRLQMPTRVQQVHKPYLRFVSFSAQGIARQNGASTFAGWSGICDENTCSYDKNNVVVSVTRPSTDVVIEFNRELAACSSSCSGICFSGSKESKCIDLPVKRDLDQILRYMNISTTFDPLLQSYRSGDAEDLVFDEIVPAESSVVDWREATRQELVFLLSKGIITLPPSSIEAASSAVQQGKAGHNQRIVYDSTDRTWKPYNQVEGASLDTTRDCSVYSLPSSVQSSPINTFYLIPLVLGSAGIFILIILIVVARIISGRRKNI